jgi:hypothetical protein
MSAETRCSAIPRELVAYARDADEIGRLLRNELHFFDAVVQWCLLRTSNAIRALWFDDPLWGTAAAIDDLASWTAHVAWSFAIAGGSGDPTVAMVVTAEARTVDDWLCSAEWKPTENIRAAKSSEWLAAAIGPNCHMFGEDRYDGKGFLVGPDGRLYALVAPHVERDRVVYHSDNARLPNQPSVLDLDGREPGWTTIYEKIGVERWRDAPDVLGRVLSGFGGTVGGRPNGSSERDVRQLMVRPGMAPMFRTRPDRSPEEPTPPPYMVPAAPDFAPPDRPDTMYPGANAGTAMANAVPVLIEGLGGAVMADLGSHAAYDVTFQKNTDGRTRALYRRVFVGYDDTGNAQPKSVWVTGPENNDHVLINYAP